MANKFVPELPSVAGRFDSDFIETADKFLNQLPDFSIKINEFGTYMESLEDEVEEKKETTLSYMNDALNYKTKAKAYANTAEQKANEVESVVIPQDATYSKDDIDKMFNSLITAITALQYAVSVLSKGDNNA